MFGYYSTTPYVSQEIGIIFLLCLINVLRSCQARVYLRYYFFLSFLFPPSMTIIARSILHWMDILFLTSQSSHTCASRQEEIESLFPSDARQVGITHMWFLIIYLQEEKTADKFYPESGWIWTT